MLLPELGVRGQLGQHPDQAVGNRLTAGVGGRLEDLEHRVDGHALRGVEDEGAALRVVAAHLDEPSQRLGLERRDQPSSPPAQDGRVGDPRRRSSSRAICSR